MESYPEHDKMLAVKEQSQITGEFIEWLNSKGYAIAQYDKFDSLWPAWRSNAELLADFFHIDLDVLAAEKQSMFEALRTHTQMGTPEC